MTAFFTINVEVDDRYSPGLKGMTDAIADELERRGATERDYTVEVRGPAELRIGFR